eukprot:8248860-Heterocapsa_arctica.AAC.1
MVLQWFDVLLQVGIGHVEIVRCAAYDDREGYGSSDVVMACAWHVIKIVMITLGSILLILLVRSLHQWTRLRDQGNMLKGRRMGTV